MTIQVHGDVAVITLNNPPVNGLGYATRRASPTAWPKPTPMPRQGHRHHRRRQGLFGRRRHQGVRHPKAIQEPNLLSRDPRGENPPSPWWPPCTRVCMGGGLELALGCHYRMAAPGAKHGAARSQARPDPRRRRHAAPAARAGRGNRAEHDRQRRARSRAKCWPCCRARSCSTRWPRRLTCWPEKPGLGPRGGRHARPLPLVRNLPCKHPQRRRLLPVRAQHGQGHGQELPGAGQVRGCGGGRHQEEV
jgi:3-hydroxyacyl-CoA dehydrogenase